METSSNAHPYVALSRFLRSHDNAIGVADLRRLGFDKDAVTELVKREVLLRVHRGSYRSGSASPTHKTFLRCALAAVGSDGAIARASAAHHQGLIDFAPAQIHLVVPEKHRNRSRPGLAVHEARDLRRHDLILVDGVQCTKPLPTVLHLASATSAPAEYKLLRRAVRQATVRDKSFPKRLERLVDGPRRFRGSAVLRELLTEHITDTAVLRSDLEADFLDLLIQHGLPLPETNAVVEGFEVDAAWRVQRVVVELDTYSFHGDERSFENDRARDAELIVAGFRIIRITRRRLDREPAKVIRQTRALLGL